MMDQLRTLGVLLVLASVAYADPRADELTARGEQFARDGEYSRAIEAFKQADAIESSPKHACMIGLAYVRRELWSQAEIFLDRCKARATAADPLPDWFAAATAQLADKLKGVDTAALEIRVEPHGIEAQISVSSFAPDETFGPRTIHLVPGNYVITATAPGSPPVSETVAVKLGANNVVTLKLTPPPPPPTKQLTPPPPVRSSSTSRYLFIGAGGAAALGIGLHALAYYERGKLSDASAANDVTAYGDHQTTFEVARGAAFACYGLAAAAVAVGFVLRSHDDHGPILTAGGGPGGAFIGIEVRR